MENIRYSKFGDLSGQDILDMARLTDSKYQPGMSTSWEDQLRDNLGCQMSKCFKPIVPPFYVDARLCPVVGCVALHAGADGIYVGHGIGAAFALSVSAGLTSEGKPALTETYVNEESNEAFVNAGPFGASWQFDEELQDGQGSGTVAAGVGLSAGFGFVHWWKSGIR